MTDRMQTGELIALEDGWYVEALTGRRFRVTEDGTVLDEAGNPVPQKETTDET